MDDDKLLECCQAILEFLEEVPIQEIPTPKQLVMDHVLKGTNWGNGSNTNMIGFTKYINDIFQLGYTIPDNNNVSYFFEEYSRPLYRKIIRNLKIKQLLK